jgi:hypothetical protein
MKQPEPPRSSPRATRRCTASESPGGCTFITITIALTGALARTAGTQGPTGPADCRIAVEQRAPPH